MAKKKTGIPQYGTVIRFGIPYYRTRIMDADGKQVALYATTCEELYKKEQEARQEVEDLIFRRKHPTVGEYCEKWLYMKSATISASTLKGYTTAAKNYIVKPLGDMYLSEVTADDIRLALVPVAKKSEGTWVVLVNAKMKSIEINTSVYLNNGVIYIDSRSANKNGIENPVGVKISGKTVTLDPLTATVIRIK